MNLVDIWAYMEQYTDFGNQDATNASENVRYIIHIKRFLNRNLVHVGMGSLHECTG